MEIRFDDRVVLVSGAAQGIGRAIAAGFGRAGARVHPVDLDREALAGVGEELGVPMVCPLRSGPP